MTFLALKLIVVNALGWIQSHWRIVAGAVIALAVCVLIYKACLVPKPPKLDQKAIIEAQQAIAEQDRAKMIEVLSKSDAAERIADENAVNAKTETVNAIRESKEKWGQATDKEIQDELTRRLGQ